MRLAVILLLLIFAMLSASVSGTDAARPDVQMPVLAQPYLP